MTEPPELLRNGCRYNLKTLRQSRLNYSGSSTGTESHFLNTKPPCLTGIGIGTGTVFEFRTAHYRSNFIVIDCAQIELVKFKLTGTGRTVQVRAALDVDSLNTHKMKPVKENSSLLNFRENITGT